MKTDAKLTCPAPPAEIENHELSRALDLQSRLDASSKRKPPKLKVKVKGAPGAGLEPDGDAISYYLAAFEATGAKHTDMARHVLDQVREIRLDSSDDVDGMNRNLATLHSLGAQDSLEGLLMAQMVGVHNLAMEFMKRALRGEDTDHVEMNVNRANKCLRTFTAQVETLNRHRGKGQQKMIVEHVHVHEGGQAIVGVVDGQGGLKGNGQN